MRSTMALRPEATAVFVASCFAKQAAATTTTIHIAAVPQQQRRPHSTTRRSLHSTSPRDDATLPVPSPLTPPPPAPSSPSVAKADPLAALPLSSVLRTYLITSVSSSPFLLETSTKLLRAMLESKNPLFRLDSNPVLRMLLWETFYKQFCAGNDRAEIDRVCSDMRALGFSGVILEYALEVLKDAAGDEAADVATWRKGMLASVDMSQPGDFIGLKWSGMGPAAMRRMAEEQAPSAAMDEAMHAVCVAARDKDISLLPAAEETWNLPGYHAWTLGLQRAYNKGGKSIMYNTYQAYLKQTPAILASHMVLAEKEGFVLGAKLVRGAYLATEKRELIWPSIDDTHHAYNQIMTALLTRRYNAFFRPAPGVAADAPIPAMNVVVASHNAATVDLALSIRDAQRAAGAPLTPLAFAQLQGMADEVSCHLIAAAKAADGTVKERVLKCTTWGTMEECLNYLLRRAAENKDAAGRTAESRKAMGRELMRRSRGVFGMA